EELRERPCWKRNQWAVVSTRLVAKRDPPHHRSQSFPPSPTTPSTGSHPISLSLSTKAMRAVPEVKKGVY
ncbi:unnamed protein product, partial [Nesidiocoris tenuis]